LRCRHQLSHSFCRFIDESLLAYGAALKTVEYDVVFQWLRGEAGTENERVKLSDVAKMIQQSANDVAFVKLIASIDHLVMAEYRDVLEASPESTVDAIVDVAKSLTAFSDVQLHYLPSFPSRNSSVEYIDFMTKKVHDLERVINSRLVFEKLNRTVEFQFLSSWEAFRKAALEDNTTQIHMPDWGEMNPLGAFLVSSLLVQRIERVDPSMVAAHMPLPDAVQRSQAQWLARVARDAAYDASRARGQASPDDPYDKAVPTVDKYNSLDVKVVTFPTGGSGETKETKTKKSHSQL